MKWHQVFNKWQYLVEQNQEMKMNVKQTERKEMEAKANQAKVVTKKAR